MAEFKRLVLVPRRNPGVLGRGAGSAYSGSSCRAAACLASCIRARPCDELRALSRTPPQAQTRGDPCHVDGDHAATEPPPRTNHERLLDWVEEVAALTEPDDDPLVRRVAPRSTTGSARASSTPAPSSSSPTPSARTPTSRCRTPATSRASRTARSSARRPRTTPARPTTGAIRPRCARRSASCSTARCAAARCTSCRSRWARSARTRATIGVQLTDSAYVAVSCGS